MTQTDKENLHKEIDLIQECIKRMANNSFLLKGWAISLVAVVLTLSEKNISPYFLGFVVLIPLISFWYLDAFFLYTEKLYRKMYEWVIAERPKSNNDKMYDLNPHRFKNDVKISKWNKKLQQMENTGKNETVGTVMWSVTLKTFYFIPIFLVFLVLVVFCISQHRKNPSEKTVATATPPSVGQASLQRVEVKTTQQLQYKKQNTPVPGLTVGTGER
jgi:hypothetical protein